MLSNILEGLIDPSNFKDIEYMPNKLGDFIDLKKVELIETVVCSNGIIHVSLGFIGGGGGGGGGY